jgi:glycosyltransferase involved in cell wall biosynthesis
MVLLEAMSVGLPMVAYDCPRRPAETIRDGVNGRLIPNGDKPAFTAALDQLMESPRRRQDMGAAALADATDYAMPTIVERWTKLLTRLGIHPVQSPR